MTAHDSMAKQVIETLLTKWKVNEGSTILSNKVFFKINEHQKF